jgi:tetratricopeptide (TPR) repeat protein
LRSPSWIAVVLFAAAAARPAAAADATAEDIARLVAALGDPDYAVRERAAGQLEALGPRSADALLTAAETSTDLEVALRARALAEAIPPTSPSDPPEVAAELRRYGTADYATRSRIMHRLLRLDDDAGIEPLARIVRLDRSANGARLAAALLAREYRPDDPFWPLVRPRIAAGLGASGRPAARFLRALVTASAAATPQAAAVAVDDAAAALEVLAGSRGDEDDPSGDAESDAAVRLVLQRCLVDLELAAGRRDAALQRLRRMFAEGWSREDAEDEGATATAANLIWAVEHGLPEAVELLEDRWAGLAIDDDVTAYAAAVALAARGERDRAARLADKAFDAAQRDGDGFTARLRNGMLLAKWGATDWAIREYRAVCDDPQSPAIEFMLVGISFSELLHDLGRDDEAAEVLRSVADARGAGADEAADLLRRLERDPALIRARAAYFASCAAAARGDLVGRRRLVEEALQRPAREVDALIARYESSADDAAARADTRLLVARTLERIEDEVQALPEEPNGYNEYAWLVANTEGDVTKAIRYSKKSLDMSPDNASYLDTLAHCRFAAGDRAAAVRIQSLAHRQEPHNRTILRNLERFRAGAAAAAP